MSKSTEVLDAIVIGAGPAGTTAATVLAQHGRKVRLYEREQGPRYHIGESLIPMTYWPLKRIGMLDAMMKSDFPRKYSVQFVTPDGRETVPFYFFRTNPHPSAVTWQVYRSTFDQMLLQNCRDKGVDVVENASVAEVVFDGEKAVGVKVRVGGAEAKEVRCKAVIDASGQTSMLANKFKVRQPNPHLRNAAVWSYYKGSRKGLGIDANATVIFSTKGRKSWFWFIPVSEDVTSIGVVSNFDWLLSLGTPDEIFAGQLDACPNLKERLSKAEKVDKTYVTKDFSYYSTQAAGEGWVLAGDAFAFIDPCYSTGVLLGFKSGEFAADAVHEGLTKGDLSGQQLGAWADRHRRAVRVFERLVSAFYSYEFSFGKFIRKYPQHQATIADILAGDVYDKDLDELFDKMGNPIPFDGKPPKPEKAAAATA